MLNSSIICIGFPYLTSDLYISSETTLELYFVCKSVRNLISLINFKSEAFL